jgi:3-oxoadipate enol-lactonase
VSGESLAATAEATLDFDVSDRLSRVRTPVLVIAGEQDPLFPPSWVETVAALIPGALFEVVSEAQHLPNLERPDQFNALLVAFLDQHVHQDD